MRSIAQHDEVPGVPEPVGGRLRRRGRPRHPHGDRRAGRRGPGRRRDPRRHRGHLRRRHPAHPAPQRLRRAGVDPPGGRARAGPGRPHRRVRPLARRADLDRRRTPTPTGRSSTRPCTTDDRRHRPRAPRGRAGLPARVARGPRARARRRRRRRRTTTPPCGTTTPRAAARVLRALEAGAAPAAPAPARDRRRAVAVVALVAVFAVVAGVLVAQSAGRREPGDTATGDVRQSVTEKLNEAGRLLATDGDPPAIELYDEVLAQDPGNVEALTYRGWVLFLGRRVGGRPDVAARRGHRRPDRTPTSTRSSPSSSSATASLDEASRELDRLDALDPPAADPRAHRAACGPRSRRLGPRPPPSLRSGPQLG